MMSSKDCVSQIIKALVAVVALIALTGRFGIIKATLDNMLRLTRRALDAIRPSQLTNGLITLHIIDKILDVDLHAGTPVRDGGIGWRQYTPYSNATTLESNMSVRRIKVGVEKAQATRIVRFQIRVRNVGIRLLRKPIDFDLMHDLVIGLCVNHYEFGLTV